MTTPAQTQQAREAMALSIVTEIQRLGAWVTNPQPLQDDKMRFEVLNDQRELVLEKLEAWGWSPRPCDQGIRIIPSGNGAVLQPTTVYELEMPRDEEAPKPAGCEVISSDEYRKLLEGFRKR